MARNLTTGLQRGLRRSVAGGLGAGDLFSTAALDLRFAQQKTLDPRITFTRASSGTYVDSQGVIRTATTNEPRFDHNPTTGESLGLLVEEQRTNLLTYSEVLDDTSWVKSECTISANAIAAPNGTTTADKIVDNTNNALHLAVKAVTITANTNYAYTVYVKKGEYSSVRIRYGKQLTPFTRIGIIYNFNTGAITNSDVGTPASVAVRSATTLKDGWVRLCVAGIFDTTSTDGQVEVTLVDNNGNATFTGTGSSGTFVWGAQLEVGSFPTSYIPTTTAAVTRSADVASITGSNFSSWYRQDEGTVYAEGAVPSGTSSARALVGIDDGTNNERILSGHNGTTAIQNLIVDGGTIQVNTTVTANSFPVNTYRKLAFAFRQNDFAAIIAPGTVEIDTSGTMPTPTQLQIGNAPGRAQPCLPIKRITYWPQRLPNETLQQITQ